MVQDSVHDTEYMLTRLWKSRLYYCGGGGQVAPDDDFSFQDLEFA